MKTDIVELTVQYESMHRHGRPIKRYIKSGMYADVKCKLILALKEIIDAKVATAVDLAINKLEEGI